MKAYTILLFLVVPFVLFGQKRDINNWEKLNLTGGVKSIDEKTYALKVGTKLDSSSNKTVEYDLTPNEVTCTFDSNGLLVSTTKTRDNHIYSTELYKF